MRVDESDFSEEEIFVARELEPSIQNFLSAHLLVPLLSVPYAKTKTRYEVTYLHNMARCKEKIAATSAALASLPAH